MATTFSASTYTKLYVEFLKSVALDDPSLADIIVDITLGTIVNDNQNASRNRNADYEKIAYTGAYLDGSRERLPFHENELLSFGTPARHHLGSSAKQRLLEEIKPVLHSITEFFRGETGTPEAEISASTFPEDLKAYKDEIQSLRQEFQVTSRRLAEMMVEVPEMHEAFERELNRAISITLPAYDAARSASIDLLAATIEASLIRLSLVRARSERAIYNYLPNDHSSNGNSVSHALTAAYTSLKQDEKNMKAEAATLDRQLEEYESLLQLVDGSSGGYQQIIKDWTRVKQETDECLKDLRRLGWTGD